mgnify:CR=1 FL=1
MTSEFRKQLDNLKNNAESNLVDQLINIDPSRRYVLFADDNTAILSLISVFMQGNGINNFILSENVKSAMAIIERLNGGFHHIIGMAVLDIDFGVMGGDVNDLIKVLAPKNIPIVIYSALGNWQKYILPEYRDTIKFVKKGGVSSLSEIYDLVIANIGNNAISN